MTHNHTRIHPEVQRAQELLAKGRMDRRQFIRLATLLGLSAPAAAVLAACGNTTTTSPTSAPAATTAPTSAPAATSADAATAVPATSAAATSAPTVAAGAIKRGGTLRVGMKIQAVDHPARFSWTEAANTFRHAFEYLTETDAENITHPLLLESWEASDDLKTWTLKLRKGIKWSNGDELVADHVLFNFKEWLNPDVGSSILGLWEGFLTLDNVKVVDSHTLQLNLAKPKLDVPENLYHYPALIMHPSFDGDITSGKNAQTGPYKLVEYVPSERVRLERRSDYWQMGEDQQPLPYLDAIEFISLGDDQTAYVAALQTGAIHTMYEPSPSTYQSLKDDQRLKVYSVDTAQARVLRVRVDQEPWSDVRVRNALKKVQDREKILDLAAFGEGQLGHDVHVSPVQPEYAPLEVPAYDPEGAKKLLAEAGYPNGLDVKISVGTGWTDVVAYAEALQESAKAGGFTITLETMPNTAYWDVWSETTVGITPWTHRSLAVMLLPLAYTADSTGKPVAWNETRWVDEEFSEKLEVAQGTLDVEKRRTIMADLERIMQERGPIGVAWWMRAWEIFNPAFQGVKAHPTSHNQWLRVWYDPAQDSFA